MLSCREVVDHADAYVAGELSRRQRFAMQLHLLMCRHCRRYVRQFNSLIKATPFMHSKASDEEVAKIMERIDRHDSRPGSDV